MIAADTNVLLRYLLRDDDAQAELARAIFQGGDRVLVTDVVLVESVWTLLGRRYRMTKPDIIRLIGSLLQEPNIRFEDEDVIFCALQAFRRTDADFADALIVYKTLKVGSGDREAPVVYTFDADALQLPHTARPGALPGSR